MTTPGKRRIGLRIGIFSHNQLLPNIIPRKGSQITENNIKRVPNEILTNIPNTNVHTGISISDGKIEKS